MVGEFGLSVRSEPCANCFIFSSLEAGPFCLVQIQMQVDIFCIRIYYNYPLNTLQKNKVFPRCHDPPYVIKHFCCGFLWRFQKCKSFCCNRNGLQTRLFVRLIHILPLVERVKKSKQNNHRMTSISTSAPHPHPHWC